MGKKQDKKVHVKQLRKEVREKLAVALADYKNILPDRKYVKTVKKASKLFVDSFEKVNGREKEKPVKVVAKKRQEQTLETNS